MKIKNLLVMFALLSILMGCAPLEVEAPEPSTPAETPDSMDMPEAAPLQPDPPAERHETTDAIESAPSEIENPSPITEEDPQLLTKSPSMSGDMQELFSKAEKLTSYSYFYQDSNNRQIKVKVKGKYTAYIDPTDPYITYLNTELQTAEKYCISKSRCGKFHGKTEDLNYDQTHLKTPVELLGTITEAKQLGNDFMHQKRKSVRLETDIGTIIVDSHYAFIYELKDSDPTYLFHDAAFNRVQDDEVVPPPWLVPE